MAGGNPYRNWTTYGAEMGADPVTAAGGTAVAPPTPLAPPGAKADAKKKLVKLGVGALVVGAIGYFAGKHFKKRGRR